MEAMDSSAKGAAENSPSDERRRYEILRVVNRGGMGEIALGRVKGTKGFEKLVVLKRLRADAERDDHLQMFDVEQEVMSRIEHPNIVQVFDQPIIDRIPYLAMEYVRGRNLDQIIRQAHDHGEELPLAFTLAVTAEVLRGLAFVHRLKDGEGKALGVVHQDMTPSNVMVSFFGEVKITDFGISYVTSRDGGLRQGVLKGKPRYVAPEVLAGKRVNNRADIYGVAVVMYEMLTGKALFARPTVKETLAAVARNELPNFESEFAKYGEGIPQIFAQALKKDPNDRYRTAEAMAADILTEAAKIGGVMPSARIGFITRQLFGDDPDVPEMDPALEEAMSKEMGTNAAIVRPQDLSSTLAELDRLLGPNSSSDFFTLPADLMSELDDMKDAEPFMALTPIPDFVWGAKDDDEILARADREFGTLKEPAPMFAPSEVARAPTEDPVHIVPARSERTASGVGEYSQVRRGGEAAGTTHDAPTAATGPLPTARVAHALSESIVKGDTEESTRGLPVYFWIGLVLGIAVGFAGALLVL